MSFLILGDVHLGKSLHLGKVTPGSNLNSRLNDQLKLLDFTLEKAIDHGIHNIIITRGHI